jgi:hypothetical protein
MPDPKPRNGIVSKKFSRITRRVATVTTAGLTFWMAEVTSFSLTGINSNDTSEQNENNRAVFND